MQTYKLTINNRDKKGRSVNRRLRASGLIPASLYGQGKARSISVTAVDFRNLSREVGGSAAVVELEDENGELALSLVQDVQRDAVKGSINHIDFQEIERGHSFTTHVPVSLVGEADSIGVKNDGGVIDHKAHEVDNVFIQPRHDLAWFEQVNSLTGFCRASALLLVGRRVAIG